VRRKDIDRLFSSDLIDSNMEKLIQQLAEEKNKILSLEEALASKSQWTSPEQMAVIATQKSVELATQASLIDTLQEQLETEKKQNTDLTDKFRELESEFDSNKAVVAEQQE
jgi:hypothetical protein